MVGNFFLTLSEITGVDVSGINTMFGLKLSSYIFLTQYNCINYKTNFRLLLNFFSIKNITWAIDLIFKNAGWLERELIEFLNFKVIFKKDTRNLLLDYNQLINPLFRTFPCEGYSELYFNFTTYSLEYTTSEFIEL